MAPKAPPTKSLSTNSTSSNTIDGDDNHIIEITSVLAEAERLYAQDSLLAATQLLEELQRNHPALVLQPHHERILRLGNVMKQARNDMLESPEKSGWKKQSESHGDRDYLVYYKILENGAVECRIDSPVEASLYVPFLAVFNEPDLYQTWLPSWKFPFKIGVSSTKKLAQKGRAHQVVQLVNEFPWPFVPRELILNGFADDDSANTRMATVKLHSLESPDDDECVPPLDSKKRVRMGLDGGLLFRPCPPDHPALSSKSKHHNKNKHKNNNKKLQTQEQEDEKLVLITFTMMCDPKLEIIPRKFLNFCTRTVMGSVWRMMLNVAEEVRDGKRPEFTQLMKDRHDDLYAWLQERAHVVVHGDDHCNSTKPTTMTTGKENDVDKSMDKIQRDSIPSENGVEIQA